MITIARETEEEFRCEICARKLPVWRLACAGEDHWYCEEHIGNEIIIAMSTISNARIVELIAQINTAIATAIDEAVERGLNGGGGAI